MVDRLFARERDLRQAQAVIDWLEQVNKPKTLVSLYRYPDKKAKSLDIEILVYITEVKKQGLW